MGQVPAALSYAKTHTSRFAGLTYQSQATGYHPRGYTVNNGFPILLLDVQRQIEKEVITAIKENGDLYPISKWEAHIRSMPHLAVSVFLFNRGRLLLQQRADSKYHSGGL